MKLIDNLHCYIWPSRGNNCNTYVFANVLDSAYPHLLIDPGHVQNEARERCFDHLLMSMEGDGLRAEDVGLVVLTHSHPDHCAATQPLVERTRAKYDAGETEQALVAMHEDEDRFRREMAGRMHRDIAFEPDISLKEGDLVLGKEPMTTLRILHTPGHSPGSISIYWPDHRVLITGDAVFYASIGRTDLPGGDGEQLKRSIEKLAELEVDYLLAGHSTQFGSIIQGSHMVERNFTFIKMNYFPML